jgi:hypothetical protein
MKVKCDQVIVQGEILANVPILMWILDIQFWLKLKNQPHTCICGRNIGYTILIKNEKLVTHTSLVEILATQFKITDP